MAEIGGQVGQKESGLWRELKSDPACLGVILSRGQHLQPLPGTTLPATWAIMPSSRSISLPVHPPRANLSAMP